VPEQDLDLDIEASLETEKWMSESGDDEQSLVKDEELDLSELEQVLDDVDTDESDDAPGRTRTGSGPGRWMRPGHPDRNRPIDKDLDFDLSDFEDDVHRKTGQRRRS
jgi:pilus assembly protein FimV